jgi:hypothetical protein
MQTTVDYVLNNFGLFPWQNVEHYLKLTVIRKEREKGFTRKKFCELLAVTLSLSSSTHKRLQAVKEKMRNICQHYHNYYIIILRHGPLF